MLRRTPFDLLLRGCTLADLQAAIPTATLPRNFRIKVRENVLLLRFYGEPAVNASPWSVKAKIEETVDGVRLTGRLRYLLDRIMFVFLVIFDVFLLGVAVHVASSGGVRNPSFGLCVVTVIILAGILVLLVSAVADRNEEAQRILRGIVEAE